MNKTNKLSSVAINQQRRNLLLNFLIDGEYWTTVDNVQLLLGLPHTTYIRRFLDGLVADKLLNKKPVIIGGYSKNYYVVTDAAFTFLNLDKSPHKNVLSHLTLNHNELLQRLHIIAMKSDRFITWDTEIVLKRANQFKSNPDAVYNNKISIELQLNPYNKDALKKKIGLCLTDIFAKKFEYVLYICDHNLTANRLKIQINNIEIVSNIRGEKVTFIDDFKQKFVCIDYKDYENYLNIN